MQIAQQQVDNARIAFEELSIICGNAVDVGSKNLAH